jgi:hypothetical protein
VAKKNNSSELCWYVGVSAWLFPAATTIAVVSPGKFVPEESKLGSPAVPLEYDPDAPV